MLVIVTMAVSTIFSFLLTYPVILFAKKLKLVTDKRTRIHPAHTHIGAVPRAGGLPVYLAILLTSLIFLPLSKIIVGILISSLLLVILGLFDDYYDLSPYLRFVINLFISTLVIGFGLGIPYISNPFGGVIRFDNFRFVIDLFGNRNVLYLADLLAIIWLTWTMNIINWSKGIDGQLPGFVTIAAFFLGLLAQRFTAHDISVQSVSLFSFIIAGAYLGFLPHNFYPQKIMPGYGGGALAGFLLGILAILSFGKFGTAILILSVPMVDAFYTIVRRVRNKQSPFRADWGHLHHRLLEIGWGRRRIAVFYWIVSFILGISSLMLTGMKKMLAFFMVSIIILFFIILIERVKKRF